MEIINNKFYDGATNQIMFLGLTGHTIRTLVIEGNYIDVAADSGTDIQLWSETTFEKVRIRNNIVKGSISYPSGITDLIVENNFGYPTKAKGTITITGDGTTTTFTVDVDHGLVSDHVAAKVALDRAGSYKVYLVDKNSDGFKETLRIVVTYDTAPADGETCYIYWSAEVVA